MDQTQSSPANELKFFEPRPFEPLMSYSFDPKGTFRTVATYVPADKYDIQVQGRYGHIARYRLAFPPLALVTILIRDFDIVNLLHMRSRLYRIIGDLNNVPELNSIPFPFLNVQMDGKVCMGNEPQWKSVGADELTREIALHFFGSFFGGDDRTQLACREDFFIHIAGKRVLTNEDLFSEWQRMTDEGIPIQWDMSSSVPLSQRLIRGE